MSTPTLTREQQQRLKHALLGDEKLGVTELRMINMDAYKERLGSEWFKYKGIIGAYATQAIQANVGPDDIFVPTKNGFAVFFFDASEEKTAAASKLMAEEIERLLAREKVLQQPPISCSPRPMSRSELIDEMDLDLGLGSSRSAPRPAAEPTTIEADARPASKQVSGYRPFWHAKAQRVVGCLSEPESNPSFVSEQKYYDTAIQHVRYDLDTFNAVLRDVYKLYKSGETAAIVFSINFRCFCAPEFNKEYLLALRQTPANLLPYLVPRLVRIPPGAPNTLIATKAQVVSSIFKKLVLQTPLEGNLRRFEFTACTILATSVKEALRVARLPTVDQQTIVPLLSSFVQMAKSMRYNALITGVDSPEAFDAAMQAKADFISGEMVGPLARVPGSQFPLTADEIRSTPMHSDAMLATAEAPAPEIVSI
ncbi:MAG: hypothetical protein GC190_04625 [Alphaproteobacteria bacterium]|nr:hypothetical protein [Alphaproteobacteria bacterium]